MLCRLSESVRAVLANRAQLLFCKFLSVLIIMRLLMRRLSRYAIDGAGRFDFVPTCDPAAERAGMRP